MAVVHAQDQLLEEPPRLRLLIITIIDIIQDDLYCSVMQSLTCSASVHYPHPMAVVYAQEFGNVKISKFQTSRIL